MNPNRTPLGALYTRNLGCIMVETMREDEDKPFTTSTMQRPNITPGQLTEYVGTWMLAVVARFTSPTITRRVDDEGIDMLITYTVTDDEGAFLGSLFVVADKDTARNAGI